MDKRFTYFKSMIQRTLFLLFFFLIVTDSFGQNTIVQIKGQVMSAHDGSPISGVNIREMTTQNVVQTDVSGNYKITVNRGSTLEFSYLGYQVEKKAVESSSIINVQLTSSSAFIDDVVVTALGIKREEKSLGYSIGKVSGESINKVGNENVINSMAGKVSGVTISSTGATGSSVNMVIRGATSLSSDNQPLFVIDGVPILNTLNNVGGVGDRNVVDYGNSISSLNSDDIESVSILKGPSAAALYGSRAGNGVVLITTKNASNLNKMVVSVNSNTVFDKPYKFLNMQSKYGSGSFSAIPTDISGSPFTDPFGGLVDDNAGGGFGAELDKGWDAVQWNSPLDEKGKPTKTPLLSFPNNVQNFVQTGITSTNGLSIANKTDGIAYRISYANMANKGIIPNTDLYKNTLNFNSTVKVHSNLNLSSNLDVSRNNSDNRPSGNRGTNPLEAAYLLSANVDLREMEDYWIPGFEGLQQRGQDVRNKPASRKFDNPYFLVNEVSNAFNRDRVFGNVKADWQITPVFSLMTRYAIDNISETRETKIGQSYSRDKKGAYGISNSLNYERNLDFLATYSDQADHFSYTVSVGGNARYQKGESLSNSTKNGGTGLIEPGLYSINNTLPSNLNYSNYRYEKGVNSLFGLVNLGYKDMIFLDLTGRNDWSSTLPNADPYFYPSASMSFVLSDIFSLPSSVNLLKLRGGIAQVGNDTGPYQLISTLGSTSMWGDIPRLSTSGTLLNSELMPEKATSFEAGLDLNALENRLRFSATVYKEENRNQIFSTLMPPSSGYTRKNINSGLLTSKGVEFTLGGTPVRSTNWRWDVDANLSRNRTRIMELSDDLPYHVLWTDAKGGAWTYLGDQIGDIYDAEVRTVTDKSSQYYGYPLLDPTGKWVAIEADNTKNKIGNFNPKFILGVQSRVSYKRFSLSVTLDWRNGGDFVSQSYRQFEEEGRSQLFLDKLINPSNMNEKELRDYLVNNQDQHIRINSNYFPLVGGMTPETGGLPFKYPPFVLPYGGVFIPGVYEGKDVDGNTIYIENLGENIGKPGGTITLPMAGATAWGFTRAFLFDASYLKLREVSLTYDLSTQFAKKLGMQNANISVYSRNILLWTAAKIGIDPEQAYQPSQGVNGGGSQFQQGIERYNITPWVMPIGFKLGLTF